ncbi:MAG: hypothetical protein QME96_06640 [Myxococcota bacterium]|nr:hypothetical protein [Myxococcota bacterium]
MAAEALVKTVGQNAAIAGLGFWNRVTRFALRNTPGMPAAVRKEAGVGEWTGFSPGHATT